MLAAPAFLAVVVASVLQPQEPAPAGCGMRVGSTGVPRGAGVCVPPGLRAELEARAAEYHLLFPDLSRGAAAPYRFHPQAGVLGSDLVYATFVDLDPGPGILDYACADVTYDGHGGHDVVIRSWAEQHIGVPVFAVADGTVMFANDGEPDHNLGCIGSGNYLIIDHGGGREGWYFHLGTGSLTVGVGNSVVEGQQIGLTASSGCSYYPHLHFESRQHGAVYEPFAGACRPGPSGWADQQDPDYSAGVLDFGVTTTDPGLTPGLPEPLPRDAQIDINAERFYFWVQFSYLPAGATWRVRLDDPSGVVAYDSGTWAYGNGDLWRTPWTWWYNDVIHAVGDTGAWRLRLDIDGETVVDAPILAVDGADPGFNRAPEPFGAAFEPAAPEADHALFCRLDASSVLDDLDWDVVRYRYEWRVNGVVVRDVTTAAHSDAIPRSVGLPGQAVACRVTATDGLLNAAPVTVQGRYAGGCPADLAEPFGALNIFDIQAFIGLYIVQDAGADLAAPFGVFNVFDLQAYIGLYNQGCP